MFFIVSTLFHFFFDKKYDNYKVYVHNLANFDAIFLLKILTKLGLCKPLIHNNKIISIQLNYGDHVIHFRDSQQILIGSLRNLARSFMIKLQKYIFPYIFVNENNLDYVGPVPDIKHFNGVTAHDYNKYSEQFNNIWSLRDETIKYCEIYCKNNDTW